MPAFNSMKKNHFGLVVFIFGAIAFAGCSTTPSNEKAFAEPTELTATLTDPVDIDLKWKDNTTNAAGYFVEYTPNLDTNFDVITALPPSATTFHHPRLLPQTKFRYRVVPYFGKASSVVEITTGKKAQQQSPSADLLKPPSSTNNIKTSIRALAAMEAAAPTDFKATLIPPAGVKLE